MQARRARAYALLLACALGLSIAAVASPAQAHEHARHRLALVASFSDVQQAAPRAPELADIVGPTALEAPAARQRDGSDPVETAVSRTALTSLARGPPVEAPG